MDFSNDPLSDRYYGSPEKEVGILIDGCLFLLKFQKKTAFVFRNNHISECIASHVFTQIGIVEVYW